MNKNYLIMGIKNNSVKTNLILPIMGINPGEKTMCPTCECQAACDTACESPLYKELDDFISTQTKERDALIPVLHKAQELFGFLPLEVQEHISKAMEIPVSQILGVVTFYHYFTMQPRGRHTINICMGTACYVRGAKKVVEALEEELKIEMGKTTPDRRFSLTSQRCFGACGLAPVIMINDDVHGRITPKKIANILKNYE